MLTKVGSLSWVLLQESLASGPDGVTDVKSRPLWEALGTVFVFGVLFAWPVGEYADARSYLVAFFAFVSTMIAFTILPDSLDVRDKRLEIVAPRPVSPRIFLAAETVVLLVIVLLIDAGVAVPALIAARLGFDVSWLAILGVFAALFACTASIVVVWLSAMLIVARWLPMRRLRVLLQAALMATLFGVAAVSLWLVGRTGSAPLSLHAPWVDWVPVTWFVDAVLSPSLSGLVVPIGVIGLSSIVYFYLDPDALYRRLADATHGPPKKGMALRVLRWAAPTRRHAVAAAGLMLTVSGREELAFLRTLMFRLMVVVVFAASLMSGESHLSALVLADFAFVALLDGVFLFRESSEPEAAWVLQVAPMSRRDLATGILWAVRLRYMLLPAALVAIHSFWLRPMASAAGLLLAYLLVCALLEAVALWRFPVPLGKKSSSLSGFAASLVLGTLGLIAFAILFALFEIAVVAGLVGSAFMAGLVAVLRRGGLTSRTA